MLRGESSVGLLLRCVLAFVVLWFTVLVCCFGVVWFMLLLCVLYC